MAERKAKLPAAVNWKVVKALWLHSKCRSDFMGLVAYNAADVGNTMDAKRWADSQQHISEVEHTWSPRVVRESPKALE